MVGMLRRTIPQDETLRQFAGPMIPTTLGQVAGAAFGTPTLGSLALRQARINAAEPDEGMMSPDDLMLQGTEPIRERVEPEVLNEEFGHLGLNFDKPMTRESAKIMADAKRAEIIRDDIIARGPGGVSGTGAVLAGGLLASATDPLELATAFVPVVSQARLAGLTARLGRIGGRTTAGVIEGAVGNVATEPLYFALSRQQQLDYGMADALLNVGFGAVLGGIGGVGRGLVDARAARSEPPFDATPSLREVEIPEVVRQMRNDQRVAAFRDALAQAAQGKSVDISHRTRARGEPDIVVRATPGGQNRPQTLLEFIAQNGGINDADPTFRGEIAARENPNVPFAGKISRESSTRNLDDFAEMAQEEGFIRNRDPRELLDAIDEELGGRPVVREGDIEARLDIEGEARARVEAERSLDAFDEAHEGLRAVGIRDATPEEISRVGEIMRRDQIGAEEAFERLAIERADEVATREAMPERDFSADFEASRRAERVEPFDVDEDNEELMAIIEQMRESKELPDDADQIVADVEAFAKRAKTYGETARVAAACLAR